MKYKNTKKLVKSVMRTFSFGITPFIHAESPLDAQSARSILIKNSPIPIGTSAAENKLLTPEYDLQIIVPAYNVERYIDACMESILFQKTKYTFKIMLVDDGSTDNTPKLCDKYANDPRVTVIHQENGGLSAARNTGLKNIFGKYIMFVDSDDTLCNGAIDALMKSAFELDCDIVEGGVYEFNDKKSGIYFRHNETSELIDPLLALHGHACFKVFKASLFEKIRFPNGYWFEDTIISFLIYPSCKKAYAIKDMIYNYRMNPDSISNNSQKNLKSIDTYWVTETLLKDHHNAGLCFNDSFFNFFLNQITINQKRLARLDEKIQESVFVLTCELMEKYFSSNIIENSDSKLAKALKNRDFGVYRFVCRIA